MGENENGYGVHRLSRGEAVKTNADQEGRKVNRTRGVTKEKMQRGCGNDV